MSTAPYQVRTTYLDGTMTRDMIDNFNNDPESAAQHHIMNKPSLFRTARTVEIMNLDNQILFTYNFHEEERRAAA